MLHDSIFNFWESLSSHGNPPIISQDHPFRDSRSLISPWIELSIIWIPFVKIHSSRWFLTMAAAGRAVGREWVFENYGSNWKVWEWANQFWMEEAVTNPEKELSNVPCIMCDVRRGKGLSPQLGWNFLQMNEGLFGQVNEMGMRVVVVAAAVATDDLMGSWSCPCPCAAKSSASFLSSSLYTIPLDWFPWFPSSYIFLLNNVH